MKINAEISEPLLPFLPLSLWFGIHSSQARDFRAVVTEGPPTCVYLCSPVVSSQSPPLEHSPFGSLSLTQAGGKMGWPGFLSGSLEHLTVTFLHDPSASPCLFDVCSFWSFLHSAMAVT